MTGTLLRLLPIVLPPLLGAIIGYVTNALAIKMLFRPLTEKRILGIRIPLTPGIIPRQRSELARSIGRMVSTKLLTEEVVVLRLRDPAFTATLETTISRFTSDVLTGRGTGDAPDQTARSGIRELAGGLLASFFHSGVFTDLVHRLAESIASGALAMRADRLLPESERTAEFLRRMIDSFARGPIAPTAERAVQRWVAAHLSRDTPLVEIIGHETVRRIAAVIPSLYDPLLEALVAFLREPETRHELSTHGRQLLSRILQRLNLLQRLLVSAAQYDRNISENMPAVIDDLVESIERAGGDPENRHRLIESIQDEVYELGRTGIRTLVARFGLQTDRIVMRLFVVAVDLLGRDEVKDRIAETIVRFLDRQRPRSFGELINAVAGLPPEEVTRRVVAMADGWITRSGNADLLAERVVEFTVRFIGTSDGRPLAEVLPLTDEQKRRVDRFLTERLQATMERRVPEIIAGLDVYAMVVDKIEGLDVASVEQLLLMVIARHLKWINLFGALLGSMIGGLQVLIGLLT